MSSSVRVEGADSLARTMRAASRDLHALTDENTRAARIVAVQARTDAPRRTGMLSASVHASADADEGTVSTGARHAGPLNYGVGPRVGLRGPHNISATRFLTGSLPAVRGRVTAVYQDTVRTTVNRIHGA